MSLSPWCQENSKNIQKNLKKLEIIFQKYAKIRDTKNLEKHSFQCFVKKILKLVMLNLEKHFMTSRNYTVSCYQALEEVRWLLRLETTKNDNNFRKT